MKAGPKAAVDASPLPLRGSRRRELAVARFALDYIRVPRGHGVRKPLRLRPWQRELIAATWDQRPRPRLAGWMLPRGQGKTSLTAVLALYELLAGRRGRPGGGGRHRRAAGRADVPDRRPDGGAPPGAGAARVQLYHDHMTVPARGCQLPCPARRAQAAGGPGLHPRPGRRGRPGRHTTCSRSSPWPPASRRRPWCWPSAPPARSWPRPCWAACAPTPPTTRPTRWWCGGSTRAAGFEDHPVDCAPLLGAGQPGPGRLPRPRRPAGVPAPQDAGGIVPPGPAVPAHRPARGGMAAPGRLGRLRRRRPSRSRTGPRSSSPSTARSTATPPSSVVATVGRAAPCRPGGAVGRRRHPGPHRRRRGRHPGRVPALAGAGDRRRPVPLGPLPPAPGRRGAAGHGVPAVPGPDDAGHRPVLRGRRQRRSSPTPATPGWPATSATPSCGRTPAAPGWPRSGRTHPGGSTPPWPPSWPMTGPPPSPGHPATASTSERPPPPAEAPEAVAVVG